MQNVHLYDGMSGIIQFANGGEVPVSGPITPFDDSDTVTQWARKRGIIGESETVATVCFCVP